MPDDVKADYGTFVEALQRRFNPDSKRQLYMVELNARTKRRDADWAAFGDAVRVLSDKAYPELAENACERLALNQFLEQIENSQVAFSVKQKRLRNVEEAAAAEQKPETHHTVPAEPVSAVTSQDGRDSLTATMKSLCERLQRVEVLIGEKERLGTRGANFVIDTGAAVSLVRRDVWEQIVKGDCTLVLEQWAGRRHVGAPLSVSGCKKVDIFLNGMPFKVMCAVTDDIVVEAILGLDFVNAHNGIIDCGSKRLTFPSRNLSIPLQMQSCPLQQNPIGLIVKEKIVIPAASEVELMVDLATPVVKGTWVVAGNTSARHGVMVAHAVVCPNAKPVPVRVVNPRDKIVVLKKGTEIAHMELLEQDPVIEISTVAEKFKISREDQSILWVMVSRVGDDVYKDEKEELFSLLLEFADVFSLSTKNLGHTKVLQHRIDTGNAQPVHLPPRRIPHARREELKEMLRDMLDKNAIEHSDSPWSSPIVLVKKKDGTTRFCVDYRKVNEVTRKDAYPLPRVDETLDTLHGRLQIFLHTGPYTTGYWQVEVAPENQPKTAFTTPEDYNRRFILDTDASDTGIGAVLSQISDEGNSDSTFLDESSPFEQTTDLLVWIRNFKEPEGQLARWLEKLQKYNFTVVHRQRSRHCNADALSRVPCRQWGRENQNVETSQGDNAVITGIGAVLSPFQTCTPNEMRKLQLQDEAIGPVYRAVLNRKTPPADVSKSWSRESRILMQHWGSLNIQNGVLWRKCIDKCRDYLQLVLPAKLQVHGYPSGPS
ncbi:hypothetical protein EMCRGX_G009314 [Ephydatia muelleri]